jgi:acetyl esterase/lipase
MKARRLCVMATVVLTSACSNTVPNSAGLQAPSTRQPPWGSVLPGGSGGSAAERAVAAATPPCLEFGDRRSLQREAAALRADLARRLGIDLERRARSAVVQRTLRVEGQEVDVVRLEVLDGMYLPLNVHRPRRRKRGAPVVMSPVGCGLSTWSPYAQTLAANLVNLGMVVVVSEGFCRNGSRADLPDGDPRLGYARELMGLRSDTAVYLQELVSALTWVIEHYGVARPHRVGVAGYSYGGQMSLRLAEVDPRVTSVSVPATFLGEPCDARPLPIADRYIEQEASPGFAWNAPIEVPVSPRNARIVRLYPRYFHTTAGSKDRGAPPGVIGGGMRYASDIWALGELGDRVLFRQDDGDHEYPRGRREDTYEWFSRTLLGNPPARPAEREFPQWPAEQLAVDIKGTKTLMDELRTVGRAERARRFREGRPTPEAASRARRAAREIFGSKVAALTPEVVWRGEVAGFVARARRYRGDEIDVPAVEIEGNGGRGSGMLLYLPERSVADEVDTVLERAQRFERVIAVDYLGIGELASDRVMLHTFAWRLMYAEDSLPTLNLALLRGVLRQLDAELVDVEAKGWAASFYAALLATLEPARVRRLQLSGVPPDELGWLIKPGRRVPDLLLHPGLLRRVTVAELTRDDRR